MPSSHAPRTIALAACIWLAALPEALAQSAPLPSNAPNTDGPTVVHVASAASALTISLAHPHSSSGLRDAANECVTPCTLAIAPGEYRVVGTGAGRVRVSSGVVIRGREMSIRIRLSRARALGAVLLGTGGGSVAVGAIIMAGPWIDQLFWRCVTPPNHTEPWLVSGAAVIGAGLANIVFGVLAVRGRMGAVDVETRPAVVAPVVSLVPDSVYAGVIGSF